MDHVFDTETDVIYYFFKTLIVVKYFKEFKNLSVEKKTLSTALG